MITKCNKEAMTLKVAQAIAKPYHRIASQEIEKALIVFDDRITELEAQLAKCQENKDRAHMSVAEKLAEIAAYKARLQELEAREKNQ